MNPTNPDTNTEADTTPDEAEAIRTYVATLTPAKAEAMQTPAPPEALAWLASRGFPVTPHAQSRPAARAASSEAAPAWPCSRHEPTEQPQPQAPMPDQDDTQDDNPRP
jgi:hypothetical protein